MAWLCGRETCNALKNGMTDVCQVPSTKVSAELRLESGRMFAHASRDGVTEPLIEKIVMTKMNIDLCEGKSFCMKCR